MIDKKYKAGIFEELSFILEDYRRDFVKSGLMLPLKTVPFFQNGIMEVLPPTDKKGWPWSEETNAGLYGEESWPLLSVVIPSYNQGIFIEEAIRSVLMQNYPSLELIIIDGGSGDQSKEIIMNYTPWLSYSQSKKDNGQGNAINMGFSIASGAYIGWLNSDDFYNDKALYTLGREIKKSSKDFYYGDGFNVNADRSENNYWKALWVNDYLLRFGGLIATHSAFWKRSVNKPIWELMNCNVDGELWIRLLKGLSKKHIKYPLGSIRHYETTKTAGDKWKVKWDEDDENINKVHGKPPEPHSLKAYLYRFIQKIYTSLNKPVVKAVRNE